MGFETENRQEKIWLVKSSTRILGPHSIDEIAQLLVKKHISIIDEVRPPRGRWKYVREHEIFNETVDALRQEQENSAEPTQTMTQTQTMTSHTVVTKTDITEEVRDDTVTPPPIPQSDLRAPLPPTPGSMKDISGRELSVSQKNAAARDVYTAMSDRAAQQAMHSAQKKMRWVVIALIVLVAASIVFFQLRKTSVRNEGYETLIEQALRFRGLMLNQQALAMYKKAIQIREPTPEIQSEMALLLIVLDRQNVMGRRILEKELQSSSNRNRVNDAQLGIAISYILEGSLREAEDTLQKILVSEPGNFNARLNLALIAIRKGEWREADRQLEDLSRRSSPHPLVLLGRAVSQLELNTQDPVRMRGLAGEIRSYLASSSQLRQELLMVEAALLQNEPLASEGSIREFLYEISRQSPDYVRDLRLDWRIADWEFLERECRSFLNRVAETAMVRAMKAVCLAESGREAEARTVLNEALALAPKDPVILFTQANLLYRAGLRNEAFAVLRLPELATQPQAEALLGKICLVQGDLACAERSISSVMNRGVRQVSLLSNLAEVQWRLGNRPQAQALIREGLTMQPQYLPLIELREKVSGDLK